MDIPSSTPMRDHWKSRHPALNVRRRPEPVATDWIPASVPAVDNGAMGAQIFIGTNTHLRNVYDAKTDGQFTQPLENNIREQGTMEKLILDRAQSEVFPCSQCHYH